MVAYPGEILELGRSCVDAAARNRPTMQLLWRGIAAYVFHHQIALMFGCASLPGTDPDALAVPLCYLYHHHLAPPALRPRALPERYVDMRRLATDAYRSGAALAELPPLIKGYLRLGGFVGDGAVIDRQFNTTDVCDRGEDRPDHRQILSALRAAGARGRALLMPSGMARSASAAPARRFMSR